MAMIDKYFSTDPSRIGRMSNVKSYFLKKGQEIRRYFVNREDLFKKMQLNHGDFNLANFLMIDGNINMIFDFDEMVLAPKEYELALTIYHLDYARETYLDRLLEVFINSYYADEPFDLQSVQDIIMFMKFRAFYRMGRFFTYYQFSETPGGHFTKFQSIIERLDELDAQEVFSFLL